MLSSKEIAQICWSKENKTIDFYFWTNLGPRSLLAYFFYFCTNLGPVLVELIVQHIIQPQCCKSRILEDLTDIVILSPTITLSYQENVGPRNKRGYF